MIFVLLFVITMTGCFLNVPYQVSFFLQYLDLTKELVEIRGNPNYISAHNDRTPLMEACCAGILSIFLAFE